MIDQLAVARVRREDDNTKTSPTDLLQTVIADIQQGEMQADGVIVITVHRPEGESWSIDRYRSGMSRTDELAYLELAKESFIRDWRDCD